MSTLKDASIYIGKLLPPGVPATTTNSIHLYCVRMYDSKKELKLQLDFGRNITFTFNENKQLSDQHNYGPIVYTLDLQLIVDRVNQHLYVDHAHQFKYIEDFYLKCSHNGLLGKSFVHEGKTDIRHTLDDYLDIQHMFLFNIHFRSFYGIHLPGEDTSLFTDLCLFTSFLSHTHKHNLFDVLANQFRSTLAKEDQCTFEKYDFNEFFQMCLKYLQYPLRNDENEIQTLIIILKMIGLFSPMKKETFNRNCLAAQQFKAKMMSQIITHLNSLMEMINQSEWDMMKSGLAILCCFDLLFEKVNDIQANRMNLFDQISDEELREDLAHAILQQLSLLDRPITASTYWTNLFALINPTKININHLNAVSSFETFVVCIIKISQVMSIKNSFEEQIADYLESRIFFGHLKIDLESILYLMTFLGEQPSDSHPVTKHFLSTVQAAIRINSALKDSIKTFFDTFKMTMENLDDVQRILSSLNDLPIFYYIDKYQYLERSLSNIHSTDFFIKWFLCFLPNATNEDKCKKLIESSISHLRNKHIDIIKVLQVTDRLIDIFHHSDVLRLFCIHRLVDLCFRQENLYPVIVKGLLNVQNEFFRTQFKEKFHENYLNEDGRDLFKQIRNTNDLLHQLIDFNIQTYEPSYLVYDLIELICNRIEVSSNELMQDAFYQPTKSSLTYIILFENPFVSLPIHRKVIEKLMLIWIEWEKDGFIAAEVNNWNGLKNEEREIVCEIWRLIKENSSSSNDFEELMEEGRKKLQGIIEIKENVHKCLMNYCASAYDKQDYLDPLQDIEQQLAEVKLKLIKIPPQIIELHPTAIRLNPIYKSHLWQKVLRQNGLLTIDDLNMEDLVNLGNNGEPMSCLLTLQETEDVFRLFNTQLNNLRDNRTEPFQNQLKQFFPELSHIDHEFQILKQILDSTTTSYLEILLDYWKNRETINHICNGCLDLFERYAIHDQDKLAVLNNILAIDEQTSGETCVSIYEDYCQYYSNIYSLFELEFIREWDLSKSLLKFLHPLNASDVDNLMEIANDWDELSNNIKIILDFVSLKNFLNQAELLINTVRNENALQLKDVLNCFAKIWSKQEFKDILEMFQTCSGSLTIIQYIYTASTDREQSKRQRILQIMDRACFSFCAHLAGRMTYRFEHEFDVRINDHVLKSIDFKELSELRDRARLIGYAKNRSEEVQKYSEHDMQQLRTFISFVETIDSILQMLTSLNRAGFPRINEYLQPNKEFTCQQGNYDELEEFKVHLEKDFEDWDAQLCMMYEQCTNLTYFSYQQMWIVEKYLYNQNEAISNDDPGYHLLKFIGINPSSIERESLPPPTEDLSVRLQNMTHILRTGQIHRHSSIKEDVEKRKQILLVQTSYKGILRSILSLFNQVNVPVKANQLFFCTPNTHWIEIRAFIYRCFYSQILHQLIQPELLSMATQDQFVQFLNQLIVQSPRRVFYLGIITTLSPIHLQLVNGLTTHRIIQTICDQDLLTELELENRIQQCINDKCTLVTSRIAGLGKSTYIEEEIERIGKTRIQFPIAGNINMDTLTERLRDSKIQSTPSNIILHINISSIEDVAQLNEFLYCLLLFRCFRLGQMPVDVPYEIPIYLELDSSSYLENLKNEIVVFKYLKNKHIDSMHWNDMKTDRPVIQFVANYLQAIKNKSINKIDLNETTMTTIKHSSCIALIKPCVIGKKKLEFVSWIHLSIFISIYYKLFSGFSKSGYFMTELLNSSSLRIDILRAVLDFSDQFTSLNVERIRQNQSAHSSKMTALYSEAIVRWEQTQPFTIIFTATDNPLFIYKTPADVPSSVIEALRYYFQIVSKNSANQNRSQRIMFSLFRKRLENNNPIPVKPPNKSPDTRLREFLADPHKMTHEQFFLQLTQLSTKYFGWISICEKCFSRYDYDAKQCTRCATKNTLLVSGATSSQHMDDFHKQIAAKIHLEYVFTADNYIKMLLVYLRVQSNLPVLIMGETGCGKTALIQCLCQKVLDDEMAVFHIHAGITNEKIIEQMQDFVRRAEECLENEKRKRFWVFFDEFNTSPSIGLLKEIICERTLLGEALPKNMVFLGACNPQRYKKKRESSISDVRHQIHGVASALHYSVEPIPEAMLEYVWDFGYLDDAAEQAYIKTILNTCKHLRRDNLCFTYMIILISESHKYFRAREDISSVSLRDVTRFCRFYNWLYTFLRPFSDEKKAYLEKINYYERVSFLALFLCYYFRLSSSLKRRNYMTMIANVLYDIKQGISFDDLDTFLQNEKLVLVDRMELPTGTAKNRALTDNIFVLFNCILNRIPVILCGRAGSSKTLAVQIVVSNLRGKKSQHPFFQDLPELIAISYQGSHNCTSESIIKVFAQADKCLTMKHSTELLPVIVFDEIGLAEYSPSNPLKVLHYRLEIEKCQYGFVGLSNWRLDASKMNRAVYLACPQPDLKELKITANSLVQSIVPNGVQTVPLNNKIIESLAEAYMQLYDEMKKNKNHYDFGLRDYYSLIKGIVHDLMLEKDNLDRDIYKIIQHHLSYNFDGTSDSSKFMWTIFCERMQQEHKIEQYSFPNFHQLIHHNLSSCHGRFLMLIGDNESNFDYVQHYININYPLITTRTLIGSTFADDFLSNSTYTEQYDTRVLMDIIFYAEKKITLFLRGLNHLYDNLYDLFNQNFSVSAKKKYCRIALGSLYHPRCLINDQFYCIVFIKKQDLAKYDTPFLNRFEKHVINMDNLIDEHQRTMSNALVQWIDRILSIESDKNFPGSRNLFKWLCQDYMLNLVIEASDQDVLNYCKQQIIRVASFDFPLLLSLQPTQKHLDLIEQYYQIHQNLSFLTFVNQAIEQRKNHSKLLIYTYTQIYHVIDYNDIINRHQSIEEIKLSHFKTELEFLQKLKLHSQTRSSSLLFIRIDYHHDRQHLPMIKHLLHDELVVNNQLFVCLIFHLQRHQSNQTHNDVFFHGWSRVMIDDVQQHQLIPQHILMDPSYSHLLINRDFLNVESVFDEIIHRCFTKFRYVTAEKNSEMKLAEHRDQLIEQLMLQSNEYSLRLIMKKDLLKLIHHLPYSNQTQFQDWRRDILNDEVTTGLSHSFNDALIKTASFFFDKYFLLLLAEYEKYSLIESYLVFIHSNDEISEKLRSIWFDCQLHIDKRLNLSMIDQNLTEIPLILDLHLPCATIEYEIICHLRQTIVQYQQTHHTNLIDFAYKELLNKSIYGEYIKEIFENSSLFDYYYHDQLTLTKNAANVHQLSTSFLQKLITSKLSDTIKDRLSYLLIDYGELIELIRLFEIVVPFLGDEETVYAILSQQYLVENISQKTNLYRLVLRDSNFHLVSPHSSEINEEILEYQGDLFIELSLMNLIELLVSPLTLEHITDLKEILSLYSRVIQQMILLNRYGRYEVNNLEKMQSCLYLATCISMLFPNDRAFSIFKKIYDYDEFFTLIQTPDQIHSFINYLHKIIQKHQSTIDDSIVQQTLLKLESEFLRHWFIDNTDQCENILKFIDKFDLWKYSAKIADIIDRNLDFSSKVMEFNGQLSKIEDYNQINHYFNQSNNSTRKIEIILSMHVYIQLIFDKNCQLRINLNNKQQLIAILKEKCNSFEANLYDMKYVSNELSLECIGTIAWLRAYLLYYIYALKNDVRDPVMETIDRTLVNHSNPFSSTVKLYIIKQLCHCENLTLYDLYRRYTNRNVWWFFAMVKQPANKERKIILPIPSDEYQEEFRQIKEQLNTEISVQKWKDVLRQSTPYCFLLWFIHYYTQFYLNNLLPEKSFVELIRTRIQVELTNQFESMGYELICCLIENFDQNSFFHLKVSMSTEDVHQRLLVLNIIAVLISIKSKTLRTVLFDKDLQIPDSESLTHHFMKLIIHAVRLFQYELKLLPDSDSEICAHFQDDLESIRKCLLHIDQYYLWLYKLIDQLNDSTFEWTTESIREKLILPHIKSVAQEIQDYKSAYAKFFSKDNSLINFIDELTEDQNKYPFLQFFNVTNIHLIDPIDHFHHQLQFQIDYEKTYPLTTFILQRLSDFDNIQYLYPIIRFINYLMQQFDHRIQRIDADRKTIGDCLKTDPDLKPIYDKFLNVWCRITLKNQPSSSEYNFENRTTISMFLLNKSTDLTLTRLQTIVNFQNEILDYFHLNIMHHSEEIQSIPIQSINEKHLFSFGRNQLKKYLLEKCLTINSLYGMSREIVYDFDEIEWKLRNEISCLPKIDMKTIRYLNYQGELYDENSSLISEIRERFQQKLFDEETRTEIQKLIRSLEKNSIIELEGSLEYILTNLRTTNNKKIVEQSTIQSFIDEHLNTVLSSLSLEYIIDLYELVEEHIFDSILRLNIRNELHENSFSLEQKSFIQKQFLDMLTNDENLASALKNLPVWIGMFKRLLVRISLPKLLINFDIPLHHFIQRNDMWKGDITLQDIQTIELHKDIRFKHAFIILKGLEEEKDGPLKNTDNNDDDQMKTFIPKPKVVIPKRNKEPKKKSEFRLCTFSS